MTLPFVSFCTTCMNRLHQLSRVLPENLDALSSFNAELVLLDYGSSDGLLNWLNDWVPKQPISLRYRLVYFRVDARVWHAPTVKNLAMQQGTGLYLFSLDADNYLTRDDIALFTQQWAQSPKGVIWQHTGSGTGTMGRIGLQRFQFNELRGFDESFPPMSGHDIDLTVRAQQRGWPVYHHHGGRAIFNTKEEGLLYADTEVPWKEMQELTDQIILQRQETGQWAVNPGGWGWDARRRSRPDMRVVWR